MKPYEMPGYKSVQQRLFFCYCKSPVIKNKICTKCKKKLKTIEL